jgi:hypothetical protein|tara:strand:+ start:122 stop:643 length:522 start_codon:yes stop_codon:yes gene_type:complete
MQVQNVRISFPNIFHASAFEEGQTKKFGATFILEDDHPQVEELKALINKTVKNKWDKKIPSSLKLPIRDGVEKEDMDGFGSGTLFFAASNTKRPTLVDRHRNNLIEEDGKPYAGCFVNAIVKPWAQDNKYGKRINFSLEGIQFVRDGDAFGGGGSTAAAEDFDALEEDDTVFS